MKRVQYFNINVLKIEYCIYFLGAFLLGLLFCEAQGIFGQEHLLSAAEILRGNLLFVDTFEHHTPLFYYITALPLSLLGPNGMQYWLAFIGACASILSVSFLDRIFLLSREERLIVALLFSITTFGLFAYTLTPEPLLAVLVVLTYYAFHRYGFRSTRAMILLGFLNGILLGIKHNAGVFMAAATILSFFIFSYVERAGIKMIGKRLFTYALGGIIPLFPFLYLYKGHFSELYYWMITYNTHVTATYSKELPHIFDAVFLFFALFVICLCLLFRNSALRERYASFYFYFISGALLLLVAYPRYGDAHLFPSLPAFFIAGILLVRERATLWSLSKNTIASSRVRTVVYLIVALGMVLLFVRFALIVIAKEDVWLLTVSSHDVFIFPKDAQNVIDALPPHEYAYVYPSMPGLYWQLPQKRTKYLYNFGIFPDDFQKLIVDDLEQKKARYIFTIDAASFLRFSNARSQSIDIYLGSHYHLSKTFDVTIEERGTFLKDITNAFRHKKKSAIMSVQLLERND